MKLKDISLNDVKAGKNWRFCPPDGDDWLDWELQEWKHVVECENFTEDDEIVYSALSVSSTGKVTPLLLLKEVGHADYGGDWCEYVDGSWRQLGLVPNPNADIAEEYRANPLEIDPSFESFDHDYRAWHRNGFIKHATMIEF